MSIFDALTFALEEWFDTPLCDLPDAARQRVEQEFFPMPWDNLSADERRSVALQLDHQHDPATEQDQKSWWDFFEGVASLKKQLAEWEVVATPTAIELALKETRLAELKQELSRMDTQKRLARGDYYPERKPGLTKDDAPVAEPAPVTRYVAYPKAMHQLTARLGATPEELAAWIWIGPKDGGIAAYMNANELDPPPRFFYATGGDSHDYIAPLMACWFNVEDVDQFVPIDRYITGAALIERWGQRPDLQAVAFIQAKIAESRLLDLHPIYGGTRGASDDGGLPPLKSGLFPLAEVLQIEAEDFAIEPLHDESPTDARPTSRDVEENQSVDEQGSPAGPTSVFHAMTNLRANELTMTFTGDRAESGLGANNMMEVTARTEKRRISLAALDLVDRRRGTLNSQGVILLGMANQKKLIRTDRNAKTMSRLREVFRNHFGLQGDPFDEYRQKTGWLPHFKIADKRGAADDRARREAELRTDSYELLMEGGQQFAAPSQSLKPIDDDEPDEAAAWLRDNDPNGSA